MRGLRSTLILLGVLVALGAYIYFVESKRDPLADETAERSRVFNLDRSTVNALEFVSRTGERTTIEKVDGRWRITWPVETLADEREIESLLGSLTTVDVEREVEAAPEDLGPFGLYAPSVVVGFRAGDAREFERLEIGDRTATGGDLYAKTSSSPRVFLVAGFLESTFDRETFDLRDKSILAFDRAEVTSAEIVSPSHRVRIGRAGEGWRLSEPFDARADQATVEALIGRLHAGTMKSVVEESAPDLAPYGLENPATIVTLTVDGRRVALLVGDRTDDNLVYAKDSTRDLVFTVDTFVVNDLDREPHDYRPKDMFEFRPVNGQRFEIVRGTSRSVFEKIVSDEDQFGRWVRSQPEDEVEMIAVDDFLSRIATVRAESFVLALPADATEIARVVALSREGTLEEVVNFFRAADLTFVVRPNEPGAAIVSTSLVDNALSTLDEMDTPS